MKMISLLNMVFLKLLPKSVTDDIIVRWLPFPSYTYESSPVPLSYSCYPSPIPEAAHNDHSSEFQVASPTLWVSFLLTQTCYRLNLQQDLLLLIRFLSQCLLPLLVIKMYRLCLLLHSLLLYLVLIQCRRTKSGVFCPKNWGSFLASSAVGLPISEPLSVKDVLQSPPWKQAMDSEMVALNRNCTWHLVPPPPNVNLIGNKWVFKVKRHSDSSFERCKARLVVKMFSSNSRCWLSWNF